MERGGGLAIERITRGRERVCNTLQTLVDFLEIGIFGKFLIVLLFMSYAFCNIHLSLPPLCCKCSLDYALLHIALFPMSQFSRVVSLVLLFSILSSIKFFISVHRVLHGLDTIKPIRSFFFRKLK